MPRRSTRTHLSIRVGSVNLVRGFSQWLRLSLFLLGSARATSLYLIYSDGSSARNASPYSCSHGTIHRDDAAADTAVYRRRFHRIENRIWLPFGSVDITGVPWGG